MIKLTVKERLNRLSKEDVDTGCRHWIGGHLPAGYGIIKIDTKSLRAHRVSYVEYVGLIPEGLHVLHKCDNPACINPNHLFLGTNQENMNDKCTKQRQSCLKGSSNGNAKLTEENVRSIRAITGRSNSSIAREYGVTHVAIGDILRRKLWKHI